MLIKALTNISGVKDFKLEPGDVVELEDEEMREELLKIGAIEVLGELLPAPAPAGVKDFKLEPGDVVELEDEEMREELLKIGAIEVLGELLPAPAPAPEEQKAPRRRTATKAE